MNEEASGGAGLVCGLWGCWLRGRLVQLILEEEDAGARDGGTNATEYERGDEVTDLDDGFSVPAVAFGSSTPGIRS